MTAAPLLVAALLQAAASNPALELAAARQLWEKTRPLVYEMAVSASCFVPGGCQPQRFRVYGLDASHDLESLDRRHRGVYAPLDSVDDIFVVIERAIRGGAAAVKVAYDADRGFPRSVFIDYSASSVDDERRFAVTELMEAPAIDPNDLRAPEGAKAVMAQPLKRFGETAKSLTASLSQSHVAADLIPVREMGLEEEIPIGLLRLDYGGLVVTLQIHTVEIGSRLFRVDISDPAWLARLGLAIPATRAGAREALGTPYVESPTHWLYQDGSSGSYRTLRLTFEGDRLVRVSWAYFSDWPAGYNPRP